MATNAETNLRKSSEQLEQLGVDVNSELLEKIIKALGIANQSVDASLVSASDQSELDRLKASFLNKKLGITDDAQCDEAIQSTMAKMSGVRQKQRGAVYYLLVEQFGKQDVYGC